MVDTDKEIAKLISGHGLRKIYDDLRDGVSDAHDRASRAEKILELGGFPAIAKEVRYQMRKHKKKKR